MRRGVRQVDEVVNARDQFQRDCRLHLLNLFSSREEVEWRHRVEATELGKYRDSMPIV